MVNISWPSKESPWRWISNIRLYSSNVFRVSVPGSHRPLSEPPPSVLSGLPFRYSAQGCSPTTPRSTWHWSMVTLRTSPRFMGTGRKAQAQRSQARGDPWKYLPILIRTFSLWCRLHNPTECPYNGSRRDDCQCRKDYTAAGFSSFQKIRIDLITMQIISRYSGMSFVIVFISLSIQSGGSLGRGAQGAKRV